MMAHEQPAAGLPQREKSHIGDGNGHRGRGRFIMRYVGAWPPPLLSRCCDRGVFSRGLTDLGRFPIVIASRGISFLVVLFTAASSFLSPPSADRVFAVTGWSFKPSTKYTDMTLTVSY